MLLICAFLQLIKLSKSFYNSGEMNKWNEIKTAYQVARLGTISAAAEALGVHRATVLRHIDALEEELGEKLFQRHTRGYIPTESGLDLMRVAQATDDQFNQFAGRSKGRSTELTGELIVTSLNIVAPLLMPAIGIFQAQNPKTTVRYLTSDKLFKLEYGEAHIAVRTGPEPNQPDNVVQPFATHPVGMYAHADYVSRKGKPNSIKDIAEHSFLGFENIDSKKGKPQFQVWIENNVPSKNIVFRCTDTNLLELALASGIGIGFMTEQRAKLNQDLVEIFPPIDEWSVRHWLVTHGDLHRSAKVQAFLKILKSKE